MNMITVDIDFIVSGLMIVPDFVTSCLILSFGLYLTAYSQEITVCLVTLIVMAASIFRLIHSKTAKYRFASLVMSDERAKITKQLINEIE